MIIGKETMTNLGGMEFFKIEGGGNDFVTIIDLQEKLKISDLPEYAKIVCNRNLGIGGDGIILVQKSLNADLKMIYRNSDGSFAALCGNGLRALGLLSYREKITDKKMKIETDAGIFDLEITGENKVRNSFNPAIIKSKEMIVKTSNGAVTGDLINVGIPYFCVHLKDIKTLDEVDVNKIGASIRNHRDFGTEGTNVTFITIIDTHSISIRIFERGIEGETLSSGTGSYSSAVSSVIRGLTQPPVDVISPGGKVTLNFAYDNEKIENPSLEGMAKVVFRGVIHDL
jgi:diaminopimelate epimerase